MLLLTMALHACINVTGDVFCSRIVCHLSWLIDVVSLIATLVRQAHAAPSFCHIAATSSFMWLLSVHLCAPLLGEAWSPVDTSYRHRHDIFVSGHMRGYHLWADAPLQTVCYSFAKTMTPTHVIKLASLFTAHYLLANLSNSRLYWVSNSIIVQICVSIAWTCFFLQLCSKLLHVR